MAPHEPEDDASDSSEIGPDTPAIRVRRIHRRDLNRVWEFLKLVFRDVNRQTVEYQRPRTKNRFVDVYDDEDTEQFVFEVEGRIVGYAECTFEISADDWLNPRYFEQREMQPLFVEELAVHPDMQGRGVGSYMIEQLEHLARLRGCSHLVLEVAENNENALTFYKRRSFQKLDAAVFMAKKVEREPDLLPPRRLPPVPAENGSGEGGEDEDGGERTAPTRSAARTPATGIPAKRKRARKRKKEETDE